MKNNCEVQLIGEKNFVSIDEGIAKAPECSGIYCIKIKNNDILPEECKKALNERHHNILYIGVATNLKRRLEQELYAIGHGTFFRSIGAVLGFLPPKGSLSNKKNKNNYKFSDIDNQEIIKIMKENLIINYIKTKTRDECLEKELIGKYSPIINLANNPKKLHFVENKRDFCRHIANQNDTIPTKRNSHKNNSFTLGLKSLLLVIGIIILICIFL